MQLTPPKAVTFWISVILGLAGLLVQIGALGGLGISAFWLVFLGFALLVLGLMVKGL